ncbi:hypothetical protein FA15DRAFT_310830 [Coprinopsis marcescibilis]|uniref:Secreted protein n=1 Tax=Coprinopsis marcescibilis TaxID=230819 RepID=A0A5C3KZE8_COPMA|nr:hypothetical protein FA15DRAFT_310830 [Coprinopsis marcescibilis]
MRSVPFLTASALLGLHAITIGVQCSPTFHFEPLHKQGEISSLTHVSGGHSSSKVHHRFSVPACNTEDIESKRNLIIGLGTSQR